MTTTDIPTTTEASTAVIGEIIAHHAALEAAVARRVDDILAAARSGRDATAAVGQLRALLASDVVPHARAEEEVLYAAARAPELQLLVTGMVFEHTTLLELTAELGTAATAVDAAAAARAINEIFAGHVRRENELLLPALAADPAVDLEGLLPVMQARFAAHRHV